MIILRSLLISIRCYFLLCIDSVKYVLLLNKLLTNWKCLFVFYPKNSSICWLCSFFFCFKAFRIIFNLRWEKKGKRKSFFSHGKSLNIVNIYFLLLKCTSITRKFVGKSVFKFLKAFFILADLASEKCSSANKFMLKLNRF